jgi:hypothetical protein
MKRAAAFGAGQFPTIACMNKATVDLEVDFAKLIAALQKCYDQFFLPIWGYPVKLVITAKPAADMWQFVFLDDADAAGALGYHDLTAKHQPISKIFVKTTLADGQKVSTTACHELCDAVEEDEFQVDGIAMSDFVYPSFFEDWKHPAGTKFDYLGKVKKPFQMLKGGYQIIRSGGAVKQIYGSKAKERRFAKEDRRGHRSEFRK